MPDTEFIELRDWMAAHGENPRLFGLRAGIDKTKLWRLLHGQMLHCTLDLADKIAAATSGDIGIEQIRAYETRLKEWRASMAADA